MNYKEMPDINTLTRDQVVPYYVNLILEGNNSGIDRNVSEFNQKIISRWSIAALEYIKNKAWKLV